MVEGFGVGGDGRFVVSKEGTKGGDGHVAKMVGELWAKGVGGAKVAGEAVHEGHVSFALHKVGLVVIKKDLAEDGDKFKMHSYRKVWRDARRVADGDMKAVASIKDGAMCPAEGEVAGADMVKGGLGGGDAMGGEWCKVGGDSSK